jgi:hypothetical protein
MKLARQQDLRIYTMIALFLGSFLPLLAQASASYDGIPERNIFKLRPPQLAALTQPPAPKVKPAVRLTGVTDLTGSAIALLEIQWPGKPAEFATLRTGESHGDITVSSIKPLSGEAVIQIAGETEVLGLKKPDLGQSPRLTPAVLYRR